MSDHRSSARTTVATPGRLPQVEVTGPGRWLLLLLALRDARRSLDPVRVQAGLFLLSEEGDLLPEQSYVFEALDHGPFAAAIVDDLEQLAAVGLVQQEAADGYRWFRYRISADGLRIAQAEVNALNEHDRAALRTLADIKARITEERLSSLLAYVRRNHPSHSRNSIFG